MVGTFPVEQVPYIVVGLCVSFTLIGIYVGYAIRGVVEYFSK